MRTLVLLLALGGCTSEPACDAALDQDADGLDDCVEAELGTDPLSTDSDGDGVSDPDELDCVSDPTDGAEVCYACGWEHADPGTLSSSGSAVGDTIANLKGVDQCGDEVALWDLSGSYRLLFMTAAWCTACPEEVKTLPDPASFETENGVDVEYTVVLFQGATGMAPVADEAEAYWQLVQEPEFPVLVDTEQQLLGAVPYDGETLPGLCLLSPDMQILDCTEGADNGEWVFEAIRAHLGG